MSVLARLLPGRRSDGNDVNGINHVKGPGLVLDRHIDPSDQNKLRVWHGKLFAIRCADDQRTRSSELFANGLSIHVQHTAASERSVKWENGDLQRISAAARQCPPALNEARCDSPSALRGERLPRNSSRIEPLKLENIEHRTSNFERRIDPGRECPFDVRSSMFSVRCSLGLVGRVRVG